MSLLSRMRGHDTRYRDMVVMYKKVFASPEGKEVLCDLISRFHVLNTHKGDVMAEGQRSVVLDIMGKCKISMAELDKLLGGEF